MELIGWQCGHGWRRQVRANLRHQSRERADRRQKLLGPHNGRLHEGEQHQATQRIFRVVMAAIAAVSLLVGGIGIMNIMLANVLERKREIGLLRALGARRRDVIEQFMREAALICGIGAVLGLVFGAVLAYLIAWGAGWAVGWAPIPVLLATLICALTGLAFGVYPARQAADLDPIAALRTD